VLEEEGCKPQSFDAVGAGFKIAEVELAHFLLTA
jgi:hypothetical protein